MVQYGFYFNMENCLECRACVISCKDKNNLNVGVNYRTVTTYEGGEFPNPWVYFISMACNHCQDPLCVKSCPTGAMNKRKKDGIVLINQDECIGCGVCINICPYKAPKRSNTKSVKCDMCLDLIENGEQPTCVSACNGRALYFGELKELQNKFGPTNRVKVLPPIETTKPSIILTAKKCAR